MREAVAPCPLCAALTDIKHPLCAEMCSVYSMEPIPVKAETTRPVGQSRIGTQPTPRSRELRFQAPAPTEWLTAALSLAASLGVYLVPCVCVWGGGLGLHPLRKKEPKDMVQSRHIMRQRNL